MRQLCNGGPEEIACRPVYVDLTLARIDDLEPKPYLAAEKSEGVRIERYLRAGHTVREHADAKRGETGDEREAREDVRQHDASRSVLRISRFEILRLHFGRPYGRLTDDSQPARLSFWFLSRYLRVVNEHEVYPNAPVVVATVEVRHTETPSLTQPERKKVKQALSQWAPIQRSSKQLIVTGVVGAGGVGDQAFEEFPKYISRDSMVSISFRKEAVVIEATRYDGWLAFRAIIEAAIDARVKIGVPDAVERVGIRYLNEIRPPEVPPVDWALWVNGNILGPVELSDAVGLEAKQWQGLAVYGPTNGRSLVMRYAPGDGQAVETGQELVRTKFTPGPFMWIDIDSFWQHEAEWPEFDTELLMAKCDELHKPLRTLFEKLITPKLREEVLRHG